MPLPGNWFIGWPLAPGRVDELVAVMGVRPRVDPRDRHLTAAFLGPVGARRAQLAWAAVQALDVVRVELQLDRYAALGRGRRTVVLEAAAGNARCAELMAVIRTAAAQACGLEPDSRPPWPHVTVDRRRQALAAGELLSWNRQLAGRTVSIELERLALFGRAEAQAGQRYQIVAERVLPRTHSRRR